MARTVLANITKGIRNDGVEIESASLSTTEKYIDFGGNNTRTAVLVSNAGSSTATVTFYHGDGVQGVENGDLEVTLGAGKETLVCLESGRFNITTGENRGLIKCKASAAVTISVIEIA
ncbi:hypothetical protein [uncultured Anaerofustis sp.]|uniref:hypothetical protein n=1 Tax=uncultured Anaerofustis sp. TaxID=904996 RepID=UPI0025DD17BA|nr:hypothetical protein [uncultured Anaerofustis sp.]